MENPLLDGVDNSEWLDLVSDDDGGGGNDSNGDGGDGSDGNDGGGSHRYQPRRTSQSSTPTPTQSDNSGGLTPFDGGGDDGDGEGTSHGDGGGGWRRVAATMVVMAVMVLVLVQEVKILLEDLDYVMLGNIMILENLLHLYPNYLGGFVLDSSDSSHSYPYHPYPSYSSDSQSYPYPPQQNYPWPPQQHGPPGYGLPNYQQAQQEYVDPFQPRCWFAAAAAGSLLPSVRAGPALRQSLAVVTIGDKQMAQRIAVQMNLRDFIFSLISGSFQKVPNCLSYSGLIFRYTFPPSCVGEVGQMGAPSRREVGHGMLAKRALEPIFPSEDDFPYIIRVESTITESNGSSSMASVCGGCLALQDAGVPVKCSIAGIATGLVLDTKEFEWDRTPLILSDITRSEDASGDMDFKVTGNEDGITAFQMDIKSMLL
ncbi:unnamed protein product [Camellia sinensis]